MLKIVAVMLVFAPGMDKPQRTERPVASYEECQSEIAAMIEAVKAAGDVEFKALLACEVGSTKADPT